VRYQSPTKVKRRKSCDRLGFRVEIAHGAVTRRPPIPLYTMVPHTESYTYAVGFGIFPSFKVHFLSRRAKP
jgi:hypothetical protein